MKAISEAWFCHIEVTNHCNMNCLYCSRHSRHIRPDQRFHMSLEKISLALDSLKDFPGRIGIIGGAPMLHPEFEEVCTLIKSKYPRQRMGLWTIGGKRFDSIKGLIDSTFGMVAHNPHDAEQRKVCRHQPITVAINDVVQDAELKKRLIDDCWVQRTWCPTIGDKGGFFCEVAYALDTIFDGPGGFPVEPGWWKRTPDQFKDQVDRWCGKCGMPVPIPREKLEQRREKFSPGLLKEFREKGLPGIDDVEVFDGTLTRERIEENAKSWYPGNYRGDRQEDGKNCEGRGSTIFGRN